MQRGCRLLYQRNDLHLWILQQLMQGCHGVCVCVRERKRGSMLIQHQVAKACKSSNPCAVVHGCCTFWTLYQTGCRHLACNKHSIQYTVFTLYILQMSAYQSFQARPPSDSFKICDPASIVCVGRPLDIALATTVRAKKCTFWLCCCEEKLCLHLARFFFQSTVAQGLQGSGGMKLKTISSIQRHYNLPFKDTHWPREANLAFELQQLVGTPIEVICISPTWTKHLEAHMKTHKEESFQAGCLTATEGRSYTKRVKPANLGSLESLEHLWLCLRPIPTPTKILKNMKMGPGPETCGHRVSWNATFPTSLDQKEFLDLLLRCVWFFTSLGVTLSL